MLTLSMCHLPSPACSGGCYGRPAGSHTGITVRSRMGVV